MNDDKFIVLRELGPADMGRTRGPRTDLLGMAPEARTTNINPSLRFEEMDSRELSQLVKTEKPAAVARPMPMKLITPLNMPAAADTGTTTWGVSAVKADTSAFDGSGVKVAVLDTGLDIEHVAFKNQGINIVQQDFTGTSNADTHGHGTHCAGTIFGRDVNGKRIGVARGVKDVLIGKVLGGNGGGSDVIVRAMQWALQNGANVISMSLGIDFPGYVNRLIQGGLPADIATSRALIEYRANVMLFNKLTDQMRQQAADGFAQPVFIIAAAGNESRINERADYEVGVAPPAIADGIISVAAIGKNDNGNGYFYAPFSNSGAMLSAPGVNILSAKTGSGDKLEPLSGTSMATPHVAGIAALWMQKLVRDQLHVPSRLTPMMQNGCNRVILPQGNDHLFGWGLVQAPQQ